MRRAVPRREKGGGEDGYILIGVLFLVFMVLLLLSLAAPKVAADIERDREVELMHRGMQYRRAIQLYYKKFAAYPPNMEALEKSNNLRFLRKRYKDPATGKDEWKLIHVGENKTPTAMGFFGQPLGGVAGSTIAGTGPGGVGQGLTNSFGGQSGIGGSTGGAFGGTGIGNSSPFGSSPTSGTGTDTSGGAGTAGASGTSGTSGATGTADSSGGSTAAQTFGAGTGQTFGGGGIIGVESTSPKATILEYKKKKHFNEWEFVYDPQSERTTVSSSQGAIGQPIGNGTTTPSQNSPSLNGNPFGASPTTPTTPITPNQPQQ